MKAETGIEGLDELIGGGLPEGRVYLLNGSREVVKLPLVCST
ncbi:ATPase domain-containing protein [Methanohalophilus euhalobius]|jgi:KaiC/GvpD/RAD55 family RecA-like ATPase|uniref:KaiC protein n=1 Tax=Methanohalophilus euhalobius TaxID=51203 RepID=A0A314ZR89_9EURY|nr:ATPase domain-containing protein [Methanohalophilus euhalobius]PQV42292.1 KaiC protein [Methanohalophilus euhalobius]